QETRQRSAHRRQIAIVGVRTAQVGNRRWPPDRPGDSVHQAGRTHIDVTHQIRVDEGLLAEPLRRPRQRGRAPDEVVARIEGPPQPGKQLEVLRPSRRWQVLEEGKQALRAAVEYEVVDVEDERGALPPGTPDERLHAV